MDRNIEHLRYMASPSSRSYDGINSHLDTLAVISIDLAYPVRSAVASFVSCHLHNFP